MSGKLLGPKLEAAIRRLIQIENGRPTVSGMKRRNSRPFTFSIQLGKTNEAIAKGESGEVEFWYGSPKGSETASGETVQAYNRFADIEADKWVIVCVIQGGWEFLVGECSDEEE